MHVGSGPNHIRSAWQRLSLDVSSGGRSSYPSLHSYRAMEPNTVASNSTFPLVSPLGSPHDTTVEPTIVNYYSHSARVIKCKIYSNVKYNYHIIALLKWTMGMDTVSSWLMLVKQKKYIYMGQQGRWKQSGRSGFGLTNIYGMCGRIGLLIVIHLFFACLYFSDKGPCNKWKW